MIFNNILYAGGAKPSGTSGGVTSYNELTNKPSINGVMLSGNKTAESLGLANTSALEAKADKTLVTELQTEVQGKTDQQAIQDLSSQTEVTIEKLESNTYYRLSSALVSLTITVLDENKCVPESIITFTAGDNITVNTPSDIQVIGEYSFESGKSYVLSIWNNIMVVGELTNV